MLSINVSEIIWTVICFFVLLFVLKKFLFGPLIKFMDNRQARIDAGAAAQRETEALLEENRAAMEESWRARNEEAKALLDQSNAEAEEERAKAVAEAQSAAREAEKEVRDQIQTEREELLAQASQQMPELVDALSDCLFGDAVQNSK